MRGVFLDWATVSHQGDVDSGPLDAVLDELELHALSTPAEVAPRLLDAEVLLTNKVKVAAELLATLPSLRLICLAATGHDNVDLDAARERGVGVCNIRGYCTDGVTQHAFAMLLALNQHLVSYEQLLRDGAWQGSPQFCLLDHPIRDLAGRVLVIVGLGTLGTRMAELGRAFGMDVRIARRPGGPPDQRSTLDELLPVADVISLHCPLTEATHHLIDADALARMKPDAILINTSRGAVVDTAALRDALREQRIGGAGIDVLPQEPPVDGDPLLEQALPNLILTPHVAWATVDARRRAVQEMAANVRDFVAGGRRNRLD